METRDDYNRRVDVDIRKCGEDWNKRLDDDIRDCNIARVRLEEHDKSQQREIDTNKGLIAALVEQKNTMRTDITTIKTEKKFLPYVAMIVSIIGAIASAFLILHKMTEERDHVGKSHHETKVDERFHVLRPTLPKDHK